MCCRATSILNGAKRRGSTTPLQWRPMTHQRTLITSGRMSLDEELQRIYDSEINLNILWTWDGGIDVKLGDATNGYHAGTHVATVAEILPWLKGPLCGTTQSRRM